MVPCTLLQYGKQFTYYSCTQQNVGDTHLEERNVYLKQHFSAKKTAGRFNSLPLDRVIKHTINKQQKGKDSITGGSTS